MFTATIYFKQQRECILRRLTADVESPVPIEIEEVRDGSVTFVLRAGENADAFQRELEAAGHVEHVDRLDEANLLVTKPSCGAYSAIYRNHGTLRRSNTVHGSHRVYNVLIFRREDLKAILEDLSAFGTVTLGKLEEFGGRAESSLTDRQRTVLREALDRGYYEWPRGIKSAELAEALGISRATLQEHLRKGERTLLSNALHDDTSTDPKSPTTHHSR